MTDENGKLFDVLVYDATRIDPTTGLQVVNPFVCVVFANEGIQELLSSIPGVFLVNVDAPTKYSVCIDPRYDYDWMKKEIEATILHGKRIDIADILNMEEQEE